MVGPAGKALKTPVLNMSNKQCSTVWHQYYRLRIRPVARCLARTCHLKHKRKPEVIDTFIAAHPELDEDLRRYA